MMLDLVQEEELAARAGGMPVDQVLAALDAETPANLCEMYARVADRYMTLAGKGRRTPDQTVEIDRLDSTLRELLGDSGLLAFSGNLLRVLSKAVQGALTFQQESAEVGSLAAVQLGLEVAADIGWTRLQQTPLPLDGARLAERCHWASQVAAALVEVDAESVWWKQLPNGRRASSRCTSRLLSLLVGRESKSSVWPAAQILLDPEASSPGELLGRVRLCYRLAGLAGCLEVAREASEKFRQVAALIAEDLSGAKTGRR